MACASRACPLRCSWFLLLLTHKRIIVNKPAAPKEQSHTTCTSEIQLDQIYLFKLSHTLYLSYVMVTNSRGCATTSPAQLYSSYSP